MWVHKSVDVIRERYGINTGPMGLAGTGNDLVTTGTAIPEAGAGVLALVGLIATVALIRRSRSHPASKPARGESL